MCPVQLRVSFQFKGGSSVLGVPLTVRGWLVNTDERGGLSVTYLGVTWSGKTSLLPKPRPPAPQSWPQEGAEQRCRGPDHGYTPATRRYNRWEMLQNVTRVFEHHNPCSGSRTAVCDLRDPLGHGLRLRPMKSRNGPLKIPYTGFSTCSANSAAARL